MSLNVNLISHLRFSDFFFCKLWKSVDVFFQPADRQFAADCVGWAHAALLVTLTLSLVKGLLAVKNVMTANSLSFLEVCNSLKPRLAKVKKKRLCKNACNESKSLTIGHKRLYAPGCNMPPEKTRSRFVCEQVWHQSSLEPVFNRHLAAFDWAGKE